NIKIMEMKVDFPVSQSHLDYLSKMYNVQVEFFTNLNILKLQGLKENVENATKLILSWNTDEVLVSTKVFENTKKEDIEKLANIFGVKVSVEQVGEVLYIRGQKEHVEKLIQEVQRLQSDSKKTYATFNYLSDLDGVIKTLYGVETYKIERGYLVYGSKEQLERVNAFLTDMQNEQKSIQIFEYPSELNEVIKQYYKVDTFPTKNGYIVIGFKEQLENVKNFLMNLKLIENSLVVVQNNLENKDLDALVNIFDPNVRYFVVKDKVYLIGHKDSILRIKNEIESFDANKEYNLINGNLSINVKDKSIKEVLFESAKLLSTEVIFLSEFNNNCSVRLIVKDFETLLEYFKSYNISYEKIGNIYYISQRKETVTQVPEGSKQEPTQLPVVTGEVSVQNGLITVNVSNKNVGDVISEVMSKLNRPFKLEKIDSTIYSMYLMDVDYETFKNIFSSWVNFTEIGSVTYISPKSTVIDSKKVFVKDGLITAKISDEDLNFVLQSVFEGFGYPVVFAKPIDKKATMSIVDVDFETFKSIMFNYGISIKKSGNVYIVDSTEEATKVRTTYTFKVPRNADKVEELIKFYGGKTMVSPSAGLIVAYDLDPKNVDDINKLVEQFITARIVSIEARIIDEAESSGLSAQIQTLFKSGNTIQFGSEGLKLNINIMDIFDGTIIDKILEEAQISFGTYGMEADIPSKNNGQSKLLASPNLMTKSGEVSRIFIGDSVPVKVRTQDGEEIRNIEGGIELKITPYVNSDGTIDLEINTSVSNFDFSVQIGGLPKINKREASTKITIKDGQTLIIGGLSREEKSMSEWKVPILGDIPIIGFLFKGYKETVEHRNITIFITAKVIEVSGE
ncbi:MAG: type II secretion system protein GspD, partial [Fervidobacterium sp.]